jgi:hypothetical protein
MGLLRRLLCAAFGWVAVPAPATEWQLSLDLRAVASDGRRSFLDNGQGKLRFDEDHQGVQLGRARMALDQPFGEWFHAHVEATAWNDDDKSPIDLTEAYVEYRPYPRAGFRTRLRAGAFYPPMSLESRARGWETPYALTPSAIGSWIGEEIRTIGVEGQVDWLGTRLGHDLDLQLTLGLFGWNDPAGTMLAAHGWALHDRQSTLFGRVGSPQHDPEFAKKEVFAEIDGRAGFYTGAQIRYHDRAVLNLLHYDNRADPAVRAPELRDFAWLTRFDAAALRIETAGGWTALVQALTGETYIAPGIWLDWHFDSSSALLARRHGAHLLAARYDRFDVTFRGDPRASGSEDGEAWTLAYTYETNGPWRFGLEWLHVRSDVPARTELPGERPFARETQLQFSARYLLSGGT